ncbi:MAG TPA: hypothetical protein VJH20_05355 [Candidatus Nanoarchaeia archaeon]|nr:hypothetical protein [Candidatus Nanoarchaeia archaeon]
MLDTIKDKLKLVQNSDEYKKWFTENHNSYLCSVFCLDYKEDNWQIDFYNPDTELITNFFIQNEVIVLNTDKIFSKTEQSPNELKLLDVKVDLDKALTKIDKLIEDKYKNEVPYKKIIILQCLDEVLWNITLIMQSFNILNIKISAVDGKIIQHKLSPVFSFAK